MEIQASIRNKARRSGPCLLAKRGRITSSPVRQPGRPEQQLRQPEQRPGQQRRQPEQRQRQRPEQRQRQQPGQQRRQQPGQQQRRQPGQQQRQQPGRRQRPEQLLPSCKPTGPGRQRRATRKASCSFESPKGLTEKLRLVNQATPVHLANRPGPGVVSLTFDVPGCPGHEKAVGVPTAIPSSLRIID